MPRSEAQERILDILADGEEHEMRITRATEKLVRDGEIELVAPNTYRRHQHQEQEPEWVEGVEEQDEQEESFDPEFISYTFFIASKVITEDDQGVITDMGSPARGPVIVWRDSENEIIARTEDTRIVFDAKKLLGYLKALMENEPSREPGKDLIDSLYG